jgi:hypothetical protein
MAEPSTRLSAVAPPLGARTVALLLQGALWVLLTGFYWFWFKRPNYYIAGNLWPLVLLFMSFAVVLFNSLVYWVIPRWLLRGRWLLALLGGWALVVAYRFWFYYGAKLALAYLPMGPDLRHNMPHLGGPVPWPVLTQPMHLLAVFIDMLSSMLLPFLVSFLAYALIVDRRRLGLERNHFRLELSYLKAQLNPQFLFNTLGHLQGLTRARDPRAGDVVLHLADLLRYTLYETDAERVPLARELEFTEDYLALERLRHPAATITHAVSGDSAEPLRIAPLLLHPFVERLFADLGAATGPVVVTSTLQVAASAITLTLTRTAALPPTYAQDAAVRAAHRRLQLQYPGRHELRLVEEPTYLQVYLHLQL